MEKCCPEESDFIFDRIFVRPAGGKDGFKILAEFDSEPNRTIHLGVTCPWATKIFSHLMKKRLSEE